MVRKTHTLATKIREILALFLLVSIVCTLTEVGVFADTPSTSGGSATLNANVHEVLIVSLSVPTTWAQGNTGDLLRNKITLGVTTNNPGGYTATMTTGGTNGTDTDLVNTACMNNNGYNADNSVCKVPTLPNSVTLNANADNFTPPNTDAAWGYSLDNATYNGVPASNSASPAAIKSSAVAVSNSTQDVYFASQINTSKASGTYNKTVNFNVVSGTIDTTTNPTVPTNPVTPTSAPTTTNNPTYANAPTGNATDPATGSATGVTVARGTSTVAATGGAAATDPVNGTKAETTTTIISGNVTSSYSNPQGVNTTNNAEAVSTPMVAVLAGAAVAAAAGGSATLLAIKFKG